MIEEWEVHDMELWTKATVQIANQTGVEALTKNESKQF